MVAYTTRPRQRGSLLQPRKESLPLWAADRDLAVLVCHW